KAIKSSIRQLARLFLDQTASNRSGPGLGASAKREDLEILSYYTIRSPIGGSLVNSPEPVRFQPTSASPSRPRVTRPGHGIAMGSILAATLLTIQSLVSGLMRITRASTFSILRAPHSSAHRPSHLIGPRCLPAHQPR